jgi:hypothetical protein
MPLPDGIEFLVDLTPYAVEFRYDVAPGERVKMINVGFASSPACDACGRLPRH